MPPMCPGSAVVISKCIYLAASDCQTLCTTHQLDGKPVGVFSGEVLNGQARKWLILLSRQVENFAGGGDAGVKAKTGAVQRAPLRS